MGLPPRLWRASSRRAARRRPGWLRETSGRKAQSDLAAPPLLAEASAGAFFRHVLSQLLEGGALQPRYVHLADAQPPRDLRLRHLLVKPHGHDRPLTRSQVLHG